MERINPWRLFNGAFLPNWLLVRSEVSLGAKVTYARLSEYAGQKGFAYPSEKTLAASIGIGHRQCQRYIAELVAHKLIETESQGMGRVQKYWFLNHSWMSSRDVICDVTPTSDMSSIKDSVEKTHNSYELTQHKKGFRHVIPERMELTLERSLSAIKFGVPDHEVEHQWEKFVRYNRSVGQKRENWNLAWDDWCDNYRPSTPSSATPLPPRRERAMDTLKRMMVWAREEDAKDEQGRNNQTHGFHQGQLEPPSGHGRDNQSLDAHNVGRGLFNSNASRRRTDEPE